MSWSIDRLYRNGGEAIKGVSSDQFLPDAIKSYILIGLNNLSKPDEPVSVVGNGHLNTGVGSYEQTSAQLVVKTVPFATP